MIDTKCIFCKNNNNIIEKFKANISLNEIKSDFVSTRARNNTKHYRIIKCNNCGLHFSNPVLDQNELSELYKNSSDEHTSESNDAAEVYFDFLKKTNIKKDNYLLEIGCGDGIFLKKALEFGIKNVCGIEPSKTAVSNSDPEIKKHIINDVFSKDSLNGKKFDVICAFMVLDHLLEPDKFLNDCLSLLNHGGKIILVTHNIDSYLTFILGEKNPVINLGHIYYFNKNTISKLLAESGFKNIKVKNLKNSYKLKYWIEMLPVNYKIKNIFIKLSGLLKLLDLKIGLNVGNIITYAEK
ncbi:class I SAM-dependent methyltransferase [Candidatus Dependentiae bacterium]|nr:class I SAM-dependent methyltransferase [Candidatus Dependentiae bacterium]